MNAKRNNPVYWILIGLLCSSWAPGQSARQWVEKGNQAYHKMEYQPAAELYDRALELDPKAAEALFNKANACYRKGDIESAIDAYLQVAGESRDEALAAKAKYNLGNTYFHQGQQQTQQDPQGAIESFQNSVDYWRQSLDLKPHNKNVAKNIEIAKLTIQKLREMLEKQQQQEKQDQQNQDKQQDQEQQQDQQNQEQNQEQQQEDQQQEQQESQQSQEDQQKQESEQQQQEMEAAEATAEEILKNEEKNKEKRKVLIRAQQPVDKDW